MISSGFVLTTSRLCFSLYWLHFQAAVSKHSHFIELSLRSLTARLVEEDAPNISTSKSSEGERVVTHILLIKTLPLYLTIVNSLLHYVVYIFRCLHKQSFLHCKFRILLLAIWLFSINGKIKARTTQLEWKTKYIIELFSYLLLTCFPPFLQLASINTDIRKSVLYFGTWGFFWW